jgi:hypothetical protein
MLLEEGLDLIQEMDTILEKYGEILGNWAVEEMLEKQ